jgi:hypothetical protein
MSLEQSIAAIVAALAPIYGAALPTREALNRLGITLTPAAICRRRKRGALPVRETKIGHRYYVTVLAVAELLVGGATLMPVSAADAEVRPGRPRKRARLNHDATGGAS